MKNNKLAKALEAISIRDNNIISNTPVVISRFHILVFRCNEIYQ